MAKDLNAKIRLGGAAVLSAFLVLAFLAGCAREKPAYSDIPRRVKIVAPGGIFIQEKPVAGSKVIGTALNGLTYRVVDARPAYYKISLPDRKIGWIYANVDANWTTRVDESQVKINFTEGISVRPKPYLMTGPQVGAVVSGYVFDILDTEYSHVCIVLPNGKRGWIFMGRPDQRFVEESFLP